MCVYCRMDEMVDLAHKTLTEEERVELLTRIQDLLVPLEEKE